MKFEVSWGDDEVGVEIELKAKHIKILLAGEALTVRGSGYYYDGVFFWDWWDFPAELRGELQVRYEDRASGDASGVGWTGNIALATMLEI